MKIYETNWQMLISKFTSMFSPSFCFKISFYSSLIESTFRIIRFWRCSFTILNWWIIERADLSSSYWEMKRLLLAANKWRQPGRTSFLCPYKMIINEILKSVKNNKKFFIYINHYLFILISITKKYSIFSKHNFDKR